MAFTHLANSRRRRLSDESDASADLDGTSYRSEIRSEAEIMLMRFMQDQRQPDLPQDPQSAFRPKYHTGKLPNSKLGESKPRLLLMGQRRSGKSSIASVVFHKMPPTETLFLESTARIQKDSMHSFMDFQVWDFPGQLNYLDPVYDIDSIFGEIGALIWVIDAQDEYFHAISRCVSTIIDLQQSYPAINIEIFVHKVDGLSEDYRLDTFHDIQQRISDELMDAGFENAPVAFHATSIYDHSIFEAFSKVIQKLIPQLPTLENLLDILAANCRLEKAYLFDVLSKIYVASDTSPKDQSAYEICSDYIDLIIDFSELYGFEGGPDDEPVSPDLYASDPSSSSNNSTPSNKTNNSPHAPTSHPAIGDIEKDYSGIQISDAESFVRLQNDEFLYLREINKYLALMCIIREKRTPEKKGLIDYNVGIFQKALNEVFARGWLHGSERSSINGGEGSGQG
ncbi:MAG: hypothetical protein M1834_006073 [Cirrosporium novae-zelandiae]|nr:MAG: hypothetical protein M1834_006073 [Cirrosporium novae-zelandiae]